MKRAKASPVIIDDPEQLVIIPGWWQRRIFLWGLFLGCFMLALGFFVIGAGAPLSELWLATEERWTLRDELNSLKLKNENLKQSVAQEKKIVEVKSRTVSLLQKENEKLLTNLADLKEQIAYYQRVIQPNAEKQGLIIGNLRLREELYKNQYRYRFTVMQIKGKKKVSGYLTINVIGSLKGKTTTLSLKQFSLDPKIQNIKLNFQSFQTVEGVIILKNNQFRPKRIEVVASFNSGKKVKLRKYFDWQVEESYINVLEKK